MANFPTSLPSFTTSVAGNTLDQDNHTARHNSTQEEIVALATKVGVDGSAVSSSHTYKINALETSVATKAADADVVHDTGNETIAGVKTFTSDPIIPDETYGLAWNGSLEPATKNAIYAKIQSVEAAAGVDDDQTASEVPFTPAGTVAATDVQSAIEELDGDVTNAKARANHTGTQTASTISDFSTAADARIAAAAATGTGSIVRSSSPTITTPTGIVKGDVGLENVDNTSNATERAATATLTNKTISTGSTIDANVNVTEVLKKVYPVGSIYVATVSTNPGTLLGFGTWSAYAAGRVVVGKAAAGTFSTAGATGGAETHTLTTSEMPAHTHGVNLYGTGTGGTNPSTGPGGLAVIGYPTTSTGGDGAHNNLQPYIVAYMWERTA